MSGRYIQQKRDGMRDPTMTHVEDPGVFRQGDYVMDDEGMYIILNIDEMSAGLRFIHLIPSGATLHYIQTQMPGEHTVHDLRPYDRENTAQYRGALTPRPPNASDISPAKT